MHTTRDMKRQLVVAFGPRAESNELDPEVVGHLHTPERVRALELVAFEHVLVEHERLGRYPLLGLDGYDVVTADDLLAVAQTIVQADVDGRVRIVEERDERDSRATLVRQDATLLVQRALVLVEDLDGDFLARVTRRHRCERRILNGFVAAQREYRRSRGRDLRCRARRLGLDLLELLFALELACDGRQRPERVLHEEQERVQVGVADVSELADLERQRGVIEQRRDFGFGELFEEALGQGHDAIGPHLERFLVHELLDLERVDFRVRVELLQTHVREFVGRFQRDLVERLDSPRRIVVLGRRWRKSFKI